MKSIFNKNKGKIKYIVKGEPGSFNITYKYGEEQPVQANDARNGWARSFPCESNKYFYLSAQANTKDAHITVKVYRGNKLMNKKMVDGDYAIATVSGRLIN